MPALNRTVPGPAWFKSLIRLLLFTPVRRIRRIIRQTYRSRAVDRLRACAGSRVLGGPFQGLECPPGALLSGPMRLGTYELELAPVLDEIFRFELEHMVNIGAAGGYYAVGFLRRCPRIRVTAFEASGVHRSALALLASTNGVDRRLSIRDACDSRALGGALVGSERTLLVVDVEGAELALLDPEQIGSLRTVWMLVEVHDFVDEEISAVLRRRFEPSHRICVVDSRERTRR